MPALAILVVEDDPLLREVMVRGLELRGHAVAAAADFPSAAKALAIRDFNVMVTDLLLGASDGTEVMRVARKVQPSIQIVAISGGGEFLDSAYLLRLATAFGAKVPLSKPFALVELIAAVERVGEP